jgi:hypothetical protein
MLLNEEEIEMEEDPYHPYQLTHYYQNELLRFQEAFEERVNLPDQVVEEEENVKLLLLTTNAMKTMLIIMLFLLIQMATIKMLEIIIILLLIQMMMAELMGIIGP